MFVVKNTTFEWKITHLRFYNIPSHYRKSVSVWKQYVSLFSLISIGPAWKLRFLEIKLHRLKMQLFVCLKGLWRIIIDNSKTLKLYSYTILLKPKLLNNCLLNITVNPIELTIWWVGWTQQLNTNNIMGREHVCEGHVPSSHFGVKHHPTGM